MKLSEFLFVGLVVFSIAVPLFVFRLFFGVPLCLQSENETMVGACEGYAPTTPTDACADPTKQAVACKTLYGQMKKTIQINVPPYTIEIDVDNPNDPKGCDSSVAEGKDSCIAQPATGKNTNESGSVIDIEYVGCTNTRKVWRCIWFPILKKCGAALAGPDVPREEACGGNKPKVKTSC
jgi:hypothetical protein